MECSNLVELCARSCRKYADRELFGTKRNGGWRWITYGQFGAMVDEVRAGLAACGVGRGDRVGCVADNRVEWAASAHATYGLGAQFVPMYEAQASMAINDELPNLLPNLAEVKPTLLFAVPRVFSRLYDAIQKQLSARPRVIQSLFRSGIAAATRKRVGLHLGLVERAQLSLADRLIFAKVRQRFGGRLKQAFSGSAALSVDVALRRRAGDRGL